MTETYEFGVGHASQQCFNDKILLKGWTFTNHTYCFIRAIVKSAEQNVLYSGFIRFKWISRQREIVGERNMDKFHNNLLKKKFQQINCKLH